MSMRAANRAVVSPALSAPITFMSMKATSFGVSSKVIQRIDAGISRSICVNEI
jgi:hypothetical protein